MAHLSDEKDDLSLKGVAEKCRSCSEEVCSFVDSLEGSLDYMKCMNPAKF